MGLRFRRRLRVAPGLWLNVSRSGLSASVGTRGLHATFGRRGRRVTVGVPGSGVSYTTYGPYVPHAVSPRPFAALWWIIIGLIVIAAALH